MMLMKRCTVVLFAVATLAVTSCTSVQPWERGVLAKPQMALDPTPMQSGIRMHNYSSREAAASINSSGGGGGCGCY